MTTSLKDALLAEIRKTKVVFYNTVVAQAQTIEVAGDRVTFTFSSKQRALSDEFEKNRAWLETIAKAAAGRKITVAGVMGDAAADAKAAPGAPAGDAAATKKSALREKAMADAGVQAMLEVFPAEIRDVEEM
jgi:hypothetical protein